MSSAQDPSRRTARLLNLFKETVSGKRPIRTPQNAQLFMEAVRAQPSPARCVEILVSSASGPDALSDAVRSDLSAPFILAHTLPLLRYLADPGVKALVDGQLLERVLLAVADPPTVLSALVRLFEARQIPDDSLYPFGWLALELISLPLGTTVDVAGIVKTVSNSQQFLKSQDHATRELGYKLQQVVRIRCSGEPRGSPGGPGGRHDNDFEDFRRICIYPTTDEFLSAQQPYYLTAHEIADVEVEKRPRAHLDNQFRLLREDMLAELREDVQVGAGGKEGKRTSLVLSNLVPSGIGFGDEAAGRYKPCTLLVKCYAGGLHFLESMEPSARKKHLQDEPGLLKHQAFGVLCRDREIFGFAFVDRDVDSLAKSPPVVSLQFTNEHGLRSALLALTLDKTGSVQFTLVPTPVFAYEPVLLGLQRLTDVPLLELLVNPASISSVDFEIPSKLRPVVDNLEMASRNMRLSSTARLESASGPGVEVDRSQLGALLLALKSPVSQIQGPPGNKAHPALSSENDADIAVKAPASPSLAPRSPAVSSRLVCASWCSAIRTTPSINSWEIC